MARNSSMVERSPATHITVANLGTCSPCKVGKRVNIDQKATFQLTRDARIWITCELLHDLTIDLVAEFAVGKPYAKQPTCLFKSRRVCGRCGAFLTIPHESLNGTERAHGILV